MKYRLLGKAGWKVSEIGFGAWGIGGPGSGADSYGPTDDQESEAALRAAIDLGINFFDTADVYGGGHSETLIGKTLRDVRKEILLASKVGYLTYGGPQDFSPRSIRQALDQTLRRLQTDYLDLYQLHSPPVPLLEKSDGAFDVLAALKTEGKIRAFGVSVKSPQDGVAVLKRWDVEAIQVNFNLIDQRAVEIGLLEMAQERGCAVIARTPLCFGFLTGKYAPDARFQSSDHRSSWPPAQIGLWARAPELFAPVRVKNRCSNTQMALRFCLSYPAISTVIPGMMKAKHVVENVSATALGPLDTEDLMSAERIYQTNDFFLRRAPEEIRAASSLEG
ncbi:MAG: aldo/keto reductase [Candidatus Omnitrophica bacterium]|nr:aldo/keto reductase [Candidatus Omnitrophota bacterium]